MVARVPRNQLLRLSELIATKMGLDFPPGRWPDLERGLSTVASSFGFADVVEYAESLTSTPLSKQKLDMLASALTVGETYFFREKRTLEMVAEHILPALYRARLSGERRLRIWSAGCCTGEEPYSIAILLQQTIPDWQDWDITLLATDITPQYLRKAKTGVFSNWSFRDVPPYLKEKYFQVNSDGQFAISPEIKRMVHFAQLNLAENVYPSPTTNTHEMDIIFCRNVLMYFTMAQATNVVQNLRHSLVDGGWMIVSPSESFHISSAGYTGVNFKGTILYQKQIGRPAVPPSYVTTEYHENRFAVEQSSKTPVQSEPSLPDLIPQDLHSEAVALQERGSHSEAILKLKESLSGHPGEPESLHLLTRLLANQGNLIEALGYCDQWILHDKLNPSGHYLRAIIVQEQGSVDDAIRSLGRSIYLDPGFVLAHFALGNIARNRGFYRQAEKHLKNALDLLRGHLPDDVLPESEGITVARFTEIINALLDMEHTA